MEPMIFRVWLGWRASTLRGAGGWVKFALHLQRVFVPATVQVMGRFGLLAYLPSLAQEGQSEALPDETALLVYRSQGEYKAAFDTVAGRAYGLLHEAVFDMTPSKSRSAWAKTLPAALEAKLPATHWPAAAGGPEFTQDSSAAVYLVLQHPPGTPASLQQVRDALGTADGEAVVCQSGALSFVWLATRGDRSAQQQAHQLLQRYPDWQVLVKQDAKRASAGSDGFAADAAGVAFPPNQTLQFVKTTPEGP